MNSERPMADNRSLDAIFLLYDHEIVIFYHVIIIFNRRKEEIQKDDDDLGETDWAVNC